MNFKNYLNSELCAIIEGSDAMPPFFNETLLDEVFNRCFGRYKIEETEEERIVLLKNVIPSIFRSKNCQLIRYFSRKALNSTKTQEECAERILVKLYSVDEEWFIYLINNREFRDEYSFSVAMAIKQYMIRTFKKVVKDVPLDYESENQLTQECANIEHYLNQAQIDFNSKWA